jgi:GNAT superfamily N-acetyltransferase
MLVVEEAKITDIADLVDLLAVLFSQEVEFVPQSDLQRAGLQSIIEDASIGKIFVLKEDDAIIGMVSLLWSISTALGGKVAFLEDMIVNPLYRGRGGGTLLMKYATTYAQKCECKRITLLTDSDNHVAHQFYQQLGFKKSLMQPMRLILSDM